MTQTADVVVIGSGGFGAATAWFLAKAGRRVALVDKFAISSQTSPRAAGLASTIRATDVMTRLASRAADLLVGFEGETGRSIGAIRAGSVKIACRGRSAIRHPAATPPREMRRSDCYAPRPPYEPELAIGYRTPDIARGANDY